MFLFLSSCVLVSLFLFFYGIGLWYLGFLPLIFFGFVFFSAPGLHFSSSFSRQVVRYPLYFAWGLILASLMGLASYFDINMPIAFLGIIILNFVSWLISIVVKYKDGVDIFPFGYWFSMFGLLVYSLFFCNFEQYINLLFLLSSLYFGLLGFVLFILRYWFHHFLDFVYHFVIAFALWGVLLILNFVPNFVFALVLAGALLFGIYSGLWWFYKQKPVEKKQISLRKILAGERIVTKTVFSSLFLAKAADFLHHMPKIFLDILEYFNIALVVALLGYFAGHWHSIADWNQLFYWGVILLFVSNTVILKKITTTNILQNLFLFLIVHFAVYVSFFSYFGNNLGSVAFWAIMWNIFVSSFLFYMERVSPNLLTKLDYRYWLIAAAISFVYNLSLLVQSPIPGELIFFLTLLYLGGEGALLFYGMRYVHSLVDSE